MLAGGKHTSKIQRSESKDPHHLAALGAARLRAGVVTGPYGEVRTALKQPDKSEFETRSSFRNVIVGFLPGDRLIYIAAASYVLTERNSFARNCTLSSAVRICCMVASFLIRLAFAAREPLLRHCWGVISVIRRNPCFRYFGSENPHS